MEVFFSSFLCIYSSVKRKRDLLDKSSIVMKIRRTGVSRWSVSNVSVPEDEHEQADDEPSLATSPPKVSIF